MTPEAEGLFVTIQTFSAKPTITTKLLASILNDQWWE